jgi:hypothetical protein
VRVDHTLDRSYSATTEPAPTTIKSGYHMEFVTVKDGFYGICFTGVTPPLYIDDGFGGSPDLHPIKTNTAAVCSAPVGSRGLVQATPTKPNRTVAIVITALVVGGLLAIHQLITGMIVGRPKKDVGSHMLLGTHGAAY